MPGSSLREGVGVMGLSEDHPSIQKGAETAGEERGDPLQIIGAELIHDQ